MNRPPYILPYAGVTPAFASPPVHAGEGATVLGRATIGRNAVLGARSVIRADGNVVVIGDDCTIGARSTLHIVHDRFACILGDRVAVGENACVHACTLGRDVVVGDDVVILDGAVVEDDVVFEAGATVFPGKRIAGGQLYAGSPAKPVRALAPGEAAARAAALRERVGGARVPAPATAGPGSRVDPSVFVASTASVRGRLLAEAHSSVWWSNDFDAGEATITLGRNTNVQDNTAIRCRGTGVVIGPDTTVGHNVTIHDCIIGTRSLIGIGAVVAAGTVVEDDVFLAAKARTEPGQVLESGWLYAGSPARPLTRLETSRRETIARIVGMYRQYAQDYMAAEREQAGG